MKAAPPFTSRKSHALPAKVKHGSFLPAQHDQPNPERQIVERLQTILAEIDRLPLPTGRLGTQFLDCFELMDRIRTKVREKARELLLKAPQAIPGWQVTKTPQRTLSKETWEVFDALARADDTLTAQQFIAACSISLAAVRKLLAEQNPEWSADDTEHELNRILSDLISFEMVARLVRSKDKQIELLL